MSTQRPLFEPPKEWNPPQSLPDLSDAKEIAIDLETYDPGIKDTGPCLLYTSPSPRDVEESRMPSSA